MCGVVAIVGERGRLLEDHLDRGHALRSERRHQGGGREAKEVQGEADPMDAHRKSFRRFCQLWVESGVWHWCGRNKVELARMTEGSCVGFDSQQV